VYSSPITSFGVFDRPPTEYTIRVLEQGFQDYGFPREILTYDDSKFVLSINPDAEDHIFRKFLEYRGVRHIRAGVNHPRTNGKIGRFFGEVKRKASRFGSIDKVVFWHDEIKPTVASIILNLFVSSFTGYLLNGSWVKPRGGCMRKVNLCKINSGYYRSK
jgi:transposase InsO family protein